MSRKNTEKPPESWIFESMKAASAFTGEPHSQLSFALKNGCQAFTGRRVNFLTYIRWKNQQKEGTILNLHDEQAKVAMETAKEKARENALAEGLVHDRNSVEEALWTNGVAPLRAGLISYRKTALTQVDAELDKLNVPKEARDYIVNQLLLDPLQEVLNQIVKKFPAR